MTMYRHLNTRLRIIKRYFKLGISIRNMSDNSMTTTSTLPQYFKVGNFNLKADQYKNENFGDVFKMIQDAMTDSAGKGRFTYICTPDVAFPYVPMYSCVPWGLPKTNISRLFASPYIRFL